MSAVLSAVVISMLSTWHVCVVLLWSFPSLHQPVQSTFHMSVVSSTVIFSICLYCCSQLPTCHYKFIQSHLLSSYPCICLQSSCCAHVCSPIQYRSTVVFPVCLESAHHMSVILLQHYYSTSFICCCLPHLPTQSTSTCLQSISSRLPHLPVPFLVNFPTCLWSYQYHLPRGSIRLHWSASHMLVVCHLPHQLILLTSITSQLQLQLLSDSPSTQLSILNYYYQ